MRKSVFILSLIILPTAAIINSCSPRSSDKGEAITGEVNIDGSSTVFPLSEAVAEEFRNSYPKVRVTVGESGTGGGFKKFSKGKTDIKRCFPPDPT